MVALVEAKFGDIVAATGDGVAGSRGATVVKTCGVMCTTVTSCYEDCVVSVCEPGVIDTAFECG